MNDILNPVGEAPFVAMCNGDHLFEYFILHDHWFANCLVCHRQERMNKNGDWEVNKIEFTVIA